MQSKSLFNRRVGWRDVGQSDAEADAKNHELMTIHLKKNIYIRVCPVPISGLSSKEWRALPGRAFKVQQTEIPVGRLGI